MTNVTVIPALVFSRQASHTDVAEVPTFGSSLKAMEMVYDKAMELREAPYGMKDFVEDLATGNISPSNVELRRHFVMRSMASELGGDVTLEEFQRELREQISQHDRGVGMLDSVDTGVSETLNLFLTVQK